MSAAMEQFFQELPGVDFPLNTFLQFDLITSLLHLPLNVYMVSR